MPVVRQATPDSRVFPTGGAHRWPSGGASSVHAHARGHLVYAASGVLSVRSARGTWIVPANRVAWTPAGFEHQHRAHGVTDMRILFLDGALTRLVPDAPVVLTVSPLAREALLALTGDRPRDEDARERLTRVLVDELDEAHEQPLRLPEPRDDRLRAVAAILHDDPADNTPLAELGRQVGASSRTLSRLFHDELQMTFHEWRTQRRIHHALVLLADGGDTTRIAAECGWANPTSFIEAFRGLLGQTPGRYRADR